jgi:hypothetical protein
MDLSSHTSSRVWHELTGRTRRAGRTDRIGGGKKTEGLVGIRNAREEKNCEWNGVLCHLECMYEVKFYMALCTRFTIYGATER